MFNSLRSHGLQSRLLCPPLSPRICSNSCSLNRRCYLTISSSAATFSFCLQSFSASGSFPMTFRSRWPEYWRFSFSISPSNEYSGFISFRIDWFDLLALQSTLNFLMGATCNGKKQDAALVDRAVLSKTLIQFSVVLMGGR